MSVARIPLLVIVGATGVGKTATAAALARRRPIEVVSADSRQVYRGMDVATGKPSAEERAAVPHHLVDVVDPDDRYHAARFRRDAAAAIADIRGRGRIPVVVGGTGLYIRALLRGLDPAPPADAAFRDELAAVMRREGRSALHARLAALAPAMAGRLHPNDHVRVVRALELARAGSPLGAAQVRWREESKEYAPRYIALTIARPVLVARLEARAARMAASGLEEEVHELLARGYDERFPAMNGIGYREFVRVVRGTLSRPEAIALMQRDTTRYAKRQHTWFSREPGIEWIDVEAAGGPDRIADRIASEMIESSAR